ncbi:hypothetical protein ACFTZB_00805 [Rhodococcus sp. NPDC057014]|uniref:hypothetical protein n=1 Tax=Rhodococcus sp. NPDC057014 TaxID=3346000 RepID=UPI00363D46D5
MSHQQDTRVDIVEVAVRPALDAATAAAIIDEAATHAAGAAGDLLRSGVHHYHDVAGDESRLFLYPTQGARGAGDPQIVESGIKALSEAASARGLATRPTSGTRRSAVGPTSARPSAHLFVVQLSPSEEWVAEFRRWLDEEHFVRQCGMAGVQAVAGYESITSATSFLNVWDIAAPELIDSPEWLAIRNTEWWERVAPAFGSGELRRAILSRVDA